jgi:glucose uptake protein GlcU
MFVPQDGSAALPMMFLLLILWGSWPACRKMGSSGNVEFAMTYVLSQAVVSLMLCASLGMAAAEDVKHFDEIILTDVLVSELREKPAAFALGVLAGLFLCIGDFVMAVAIDLLGVTIACPVGFGIPLTIGTTLNYVLEPKADPTLLFLGVLCCVCGMLSDTASHAHRKDHECKPPQEPSVCEPEVHEAVVQSAEKQPGSDHQPITLVGIQPNEQGKGKPAWKWKVLLVPIVGGSCCAAAGPICTAAGAQGGLDPYVIVLGFMIGQMLMLVPLLSVYVAIAKPESMVSSSPGLGIPAAILTHFFRSIPKAPRSFFWNVMAGICTGTGWFLFQVGTPVVSRAVGFIFGCSSPLTCMFYGMLVFREFHGQPLRSKLYSMLAAFFFATALALMTFASL